MTAVNRFGRLLALAGLLGLAAPGLAQAPRGVQTVHTNRASFTLPVRMDERDRAELKELKFFVRAPHGSRPGEWVCLETAPPSKSTFSYQAPQDGEYWFTFVTVDKSNQVAPADLNAAPPGLVVIVDTKAPEIDVQKLQVVTGEVFVQCQLRDTNPDYAKLRVEYQTADKAWRALQSLPDAPGVFRVPDPAVLRGVVRAITADKAGNRAVREVDLSQDRAAAAPPLSPPPPARPPVTPVGMGDAPRVAEKAAVPDAGAAPRQLLNNLRCRMDYALDTPGAARVEAYATRDGGRTWLRLGEDPDRRSPFELNLPEDGVYGIALAVSTTGRPAPPPAAGEAPDWWVEIDTTRPAVAVRDIRVGSGDEAGQLVLNWAVHDKNLVPEAVDLFWAGQPDGPWLAAARSLKPEGSARWPVPREAGGRVYLRLEAADRAGNVGRWETREPIVLEGARPKARVIGITVGRP